MFASALPHTLDGSRETRGPALAALLVDEFDRDAPLVSIPRSEIHIVVRFGPTILGGVDAHVMGVRQTVRRKIIHSGQRSVTARLHLGAHRAVLGVPASALAERNVSLDELWRPAAYRQLVDRMGDARDTAEAAGVLEAAIAERMLSTQATPDRLALRAAERLSDASVTEVAAGLHVSERHLRRLFHEAFGVSPKGFSRLARFHRALRASRQVNAASWGAIAVMAGYYDQAHLIAEFRAIAGVTPRQLLGELEGRSAIAGTPAERAAVR